MANPTIAPSYPGDHTIALTPSKATIHHGANPAETLDVLTLSLPSDVSFTVPLHYHCRTTEWMKVLKGRVHGVVDGEERTMGPDDDWLEVAPGVAHSFDKRAGEGDVVWLERAGPDSAAKKRFFEDLFDGGKMRSFCGIMACFYRDGDGFPALPGRPWSTPIAYFMVYVIGGLGHHLGLSKPGKHMGAGKRD